MSAFFDDDELLKSVSPSEDDDDDFDVDDEEDILDEKEADNAAKSSTAAPPNPPQSPHQNPFGTPVNNTSPWSTNTGNNTWRPTFTPAGGNNGQTVFPGNTWNSNNGSTWNNGQQQNQFGSTWNNGGYRPYQNTWNPTGGTTWGSTVGTTSGKQSLPRQKKIIMCDLLDNVIEPLSAQGRAGVQPQGIFDMRIRFEVLDRFRAINPEFLFILTNQNFTQGTPGEKVFKAMVDYLVLAIAEYMRIPYENVRCFVKTGYDVRDPFVKPNVGLMQAALRGIPDLKEKYKKEDILVCGSASGLAGQGNRDIEMAKRFGVDYIDISELLSYYF
jgi:hypothetical protein